MFFWKWNNVPVSWMCKKYIAVSDSSTESEIMSLDAGLRVDGELALDLLDKVIEVLCSNNNNVQPKHTSIQETGVRLVVPKSRPRKSKKNRRLIN